MLSQEEPKMAKKAAKESPERLHAIVKLLRTGRSFNNAELAAKLEVSESTARRDIDVLRDRYGCSLDYDATSRGWTLKDDTFELPGLWFNPSEIHALLAMLHLLRGLQPGLLDPHVEPLRSRLTELLNERGHSIEEVERRFKIIHFATRKVEVKHFELVTSAVLRRKRLVLEYANRDKRETTTREVSPLQLVHYRGNWLLDAYCHMREKLRTFALDAIQTVAIADKAAIEVSRQELAAHFESGYGIYAGVADKRARLKFTPAIAQYVSLETWHEKQTSYRESDGSFVLEVPYSFDTELVKDLLRFGADVEVLSPPDLRQAVAGALCAAANIYS